MPTAIPPRRAPPGGRAAALALLAASLLGGCASLPPVGPTPHAWAGRFAATTSRGEQREAVSGRFTLAASPESTTLDLASPLGVTLARVRIEDGGATLTAPQADGSLASWRGDSADELAESVLGFALPVAGLVYWIAGSAVPQRPARLSPPGGPVERIEQDGWTIVVEERFGGSGAPRRLSLAHAAGGAAAPSLLLRLVLDGPGGAAAVVAP